MKNVRMKVTVEQPVSYPESEGGPVPLNAIATRGAYATTRSVVEGEIEGEGTIREAWKIADGSEISLPDAAADTLISLGYAEEI